MRCRAECGGWQAKSVRMGVGVWSTICIWFGKTTNVSVTA